MNNFTVKLRKDEKSTTIFNLCALKMSRNKFENTLFKEAKGYYSLDYTVFVNPHYMHNHLTTLSISNDCSLEQTIINLLNDNSRCICKMLSSMKKHNTDVCITASISNNTKDVEKEIEKDFKKDFLEHSKEKNIFVFDPIDSFVGIDGTIWNCKNCYYIYSNDYKEKRTLYYYAEIEQDKTLVVKIQDNNYVLDEDFLDYVIIPLIQNYYSN